MKPGEVKRTDLPDGRVGWSLSQTALNRFRKCPENARLLYGGAPERMGPEPILGIALHAGIAEYLNDTGDEIEAIAATVDELIHDDVWQGREYHNKRPHPYRPDLLDACLRQFGHWLDHGARPTGRLVAVERTLSAPLYETERHVVSVHGTLDALSVSDDNVLVVTDWKFPVDQWSQLWKKDRYDVQPTLYWLLASTWSTDHLDLPVEFRYESLAWMHKPVSLICPRGPVDVAAVAAEAAGVVALLEGGLERWPLNPTDWWCSKKWCSTWDICLGATGLTRYTLS